MSACPISRSASTPALDSVLHSSHEQHCLLAHWQQCFDAHALPTEAMRVPIHVAMLVAMQVAMRVAMLVAMRVAMRCCHVRASFHAYGHASRPKA